MSGIDLIHLRLKKKGKFNKKMKRSNKRRHRKREATGKRSALLIFKNG